MDRPTCETCPYWDQWEENAFMGHCRRNAPVAVTLPLTKPDRDDYDINNDPTLPNMCSDEWCGEHPDFPAWIEHNRRSKSDCQENIRRQEEST